MYEDEFLEGDYEDRYTVQGDWDAEDDFDIEDICDDCGCYDCDGTCMDESDFHYDSPSLQDTMAEWPSYAN